MLSVKLTSCHNTLNANKLSKIHGTERTRIDMIVAKAATETNVEWLLIQIGVSKRVMKLLNNVSERLVKCRKVFTRIVDKTVKKVVVFCQLRCFHVHSALHILFSILAIVLTQCVNAYYQAAFVGCQQGGDLRPIAASLLCTWYILNDE